MTSTRIYSLCIIRQEVRILLGMKKRGFGRGKWNGFGGKLQAGESIEEAAVREVKEESGIDIRSLEKAGVIEFEFCGNPEIMQVHIFRSADFSGVPEESDEMRPCWFPIDEIPYGEMWPDDSYWLPLLLDHRKFTGKFIYGEDGQIDNYDLAEAVSL